MISQNIETINNGKTDKVSRYKWIKKDSPGEFRMIAKTLLRMAEEYQRGVLIGKVQRMAREWSWISCGAIIVALRDGVFWVVDGQHRVLAALRRSDIDRLPCLVFETATIAEEAVAFLDVNGNRAAVSAISKLTARSASNDQLAMFVLDSIASAGLVIKPTLSGKGQIKCVASCMRMAEEDRDSYARALNLLSELCRKQECSVLERPLAALFYLDKNIVGGLTNKRLLERVQGVGAEGLLLAANRAAAFYASGGMKVWASGVLDAVNKGLRYKFAFISDAQT